MLYVHLINSWSLWPGPAPQSFTAAVLVSHRHKNHLITFNSSCLQVCSQLDLGFHFSHLEIIATQASLMLQFTDGRSSSEAYKGLSAYLQVLVRAERWAHRPFCWLWRSPFWQRAFRYITSCLGARRSVRLFSQLKKQNTISPHYFLINAGVTVGVGFISCLWRTPLTQAWTHFNQLAPCF